MRRTILALVLAIGTLVLAAPAAQAEPKPKDKLYLGFGGNYSFGNGAVGKHSAVGALPGIQPNQGFGDVFGNGFGFSGYIGGSLMDNLSGQLVYTGEFYSFKALDLDVHWFMAEAKANARLGRYDPYLIVGIGGVLGSIKVPGTAANIDTDFEFASTFAGGMDVYVTDTVAVQPEVRVRLLKDGGVRIYPVSLGVNFLFLME